MKQPKSEEFSSANVKQQGKVNFSESDCGEEEPHLRYARKYSNTQIKHF